MRVENPNVGLGASKQEATGNDSAYYKADRLQNGVDGEKS